MKNNKQLVECSKHLNIERLNWRKHSSVDWIFEPNHPQDFEYSYQSNFYTCSHEYKHLVHLLVHILCHNLSYQQVPIDHHQSDSSMVLHYKIGNSSFWKTFSLHLPYLSPWHVSAMDCESNDPAHNWLGIWLPDLIRSHCLPSVMTKTTCWRVSLALSAISNKRPQPIALCSKQIVVFFFSVHWTYTVNVPSTG